MDKITLQRIDRLHPNLRSEAKEIYFEILNTGISIRVTQSLRTVIYQDSLYAQGRTRPGKKVTWVKGLDSLHCWGFALDFCLLTENGKNISWDRLKDYNGDGKADWQQVIDIFKSHGWEAGADWHNADPPHLQKTFNNTINRFKHLVSIGQIDENGYVKI